jgi:Zn-dependent protease with chaperone function
MEDIHSLYPPAPAGVPPDLTQPSAAYRIRVVVVLICLIVFLLIYLTLTLGSAVVCYICFSSLGTRESASVPASFPSGSRSPDNPFPRPPAPPRRTAAGGERAIFWPLVGGIMSGLLCLYMVKGLFKWRRRQDRTYIEITAADQPRLFAFLRRLCAETGAPLPRRVFLAPDVTAAVFSSESLLCLLFPGRQYLVIGLALVNRLNLSEFKAVLAHEFGHFSQQSTKLGSYVYVANRIVADVVYGRDWLDDLLSGLRRSDIRVAVFAWLFTGILWTIRKGLDLLFRSINFAHASLSRQMEYNADLVAVRAAGSDAIVFALARLEAAAEALDQTWADLITAADHRRFSRDLYYHHTRALEYLKVRRNDPQLGEVPPLPAEPTQTVWVFRPDDVRPPRMWATHPSNYDRERNAKRYYVRAVLDTRSAWELFVNAAAVREQMTRKVYQAARLTLPEVLEEPEAVQAFIDAEHAETTYSRRYQGLYDNRYIDPGDITELCQQRAVAASVKPLALYAAYQRLWGEDLARFMEAHKKRAAEARMLASFASGLLEPAGHRREYRGRAYSRKEALWLLRAVEAELQRDFQQMARLDREVFWVHYLMAEQLSPDEADDLERWYRFHLDLQGLHALLAAHRRQIQDTLAGLGAERYLSNEQFQKALAVFRSAHEALYNALQAAHFLALPPLKNMEAGSSLGAFLLSQPLLPGLDAHAQTLDGAWINLFLSQLGEVLDKSARILSKSLGGLLAKQEDLAARWQAAYLPAAPADPPGTPSSCQLPTLPSATSPPASNPPAPHTPADSTG